MGMHQEKTSGNRQERIRFPPLENAGEGRHPLGRTVLILAPAYPMSALGIVHLRLATRNLFACRGVGLRLRRFLLDLRAQWPEH